MKDDLKSIPPEAESAERDIEDDKGKDESFDPPEVATMVGVEHLTIELSEERIGSKFGEPGIERDEASRDKLAEKE